LPSFFTSLFYTSSLIFIPPYTIFEALPNQQKGFELFINILKKYKITKWTLITALPLYWEPKTEVFIKPTTAKNILQYFEIKNLKYSPTPYYEFYSGYRNFINEIKSIANPSIAKNNAEFSSFLMMAINIINKK